MCDNSVIDDVHTPGPWSLKVAGVFLSVESPDKFNPVILWPGFDNCDRPAQENLANARLIAAAPELLAACQLVSLWMLGGQPGPHSDSIVLAKVQSAIRKATSKVV